MRRVVCRTKEELDRELGLLNKELFAWDTETWAVGGTKDNKWALRQDKLHLTGASFCDGENSFYVVIDSPTNTNKVQSVKDSEFVSIFKKHFPSLKGVRNIAHNWVFDARVMYKYNIDFEESKNFDTMVADHLINENRPHGLKKLVPLLLNKEVVEFSEVGENHYKEEFWNYGLDDAENTWGLYKLLRPLLKKEDVEWPFFKIEMPFQKALLSMHINGILIDKEKLLKDRDRVKELSMKYYTELLDYLGIKYSLQTTLGGNDLEIVSSLNLNSPQQVIELFKQQGIEIKEKTAKGNPSVGVKTLKENKDHPFVKVLMKYRKVSKLYNAFYEPFPAYIQDDGRIRTNLHQARAKTNRLSSSNPNLQQMANSDEDDTETPKLREIMIASHGHKMIAVDFEQQESRIMTELSQDPTLMDIILKGGDIHLFSANAAFNLGIPREYLYQGHPKFKEIKSKHSKERKKAKIFSFSIPFGAGAHNISANFGISEDEAQKMLDNYFKEFPKLKEAIENAHKTVEDQGFVVSMAKTKRRLSLTDDFASNAKKLRQSFNYLIQSTGAAMTKVAINKIYNYSKKYPHYGIKLLAPVHDEQIVECPEEHVDHVMKVCMKCFESVTPKSFRLRMTSDANYGNNYEEAK